MSTSEDKPRIGRPPTGQMPKRYFRMDDDGWQQIQSAAIASGETTSEYVRRVLSKDAARTLAKQEK